MAELSALFGVFLLFVIILLVAGILYTVTKGRRRRPVQGVVIIQEGRLPGELPGDQGAVEITCPTCGRKFKHRYVFEEELVKCPYCGNEVM